MRYADGFSNADRLPWTAFRRTVFLGVMIGGTLRDLGIGTGKQDLKQCDIVYQGHYLTVHPQDVMVTLGMVPSTYVSVRSRLELMYAMYLWLDENRDLWDATQRLTDNSDSHLLDGEAR